MKTVTVIEGCKLKVQSNGYPSPNKPIVGNLTVSGEEAKASFIEDDTAKVIIGERKSRQVLRGKYCSVWYHPEKKRYTVRVSVELTKSGIIDGELDAEICFNYLKRQLTKNN